MPEPAVSVVIPVYNGAPWIADALASALAQPWPNKEVVVVDDGSTDETRQIVARYAPAVRLLTQPRRGAPAARNRGLHAAAGPFVKFLDADDLLAEDALARQVADTLALADPRSIVFGPSRWMKGGQRLPIQDEAVWARYNTSADQLGLLVAHNIQVCGPLHRKAVLLEVGGFREELPWAQEYDLHLRLALGGYRFVYRPPVVAYVRDHDGPDRITNQHHAVRDPARDLERLRQLGALLEAYAGTPLPAPVRRALGQRAWRLGRKLLRHGRPADARLYFEEARRHDAEGCVVGSAWYRLLVRLLGPERAEQAGRLRPSQR